MAQFATSGFCKSYRLDLYLNDSGRQPWVREDILSCLCNEYKPDKVWNVYLYKLVSERRNSFFTTHAILKKITYLFKRHSSFEQRFWCLSKILWWLVLLGGPTSEKCLNNFSDANGIENFYKEPSCFENQNNASCIDLLLTRYPKCFRNTTIIKTEISDFHILVLTALKTFHK